MSATAQMLEIPEVRARVSPVTVGQYHQFPEFNENGKRTELVRGVVIESDAMLECAAIPNVRVNLAELFGR